MDKIVPGSLNSQKRKIKNKKLYILANTIIWTSLFAAFYSGYIFFDTNHINEWYLFANLFLLILGVVLIDKSKAPLKSNIDHDTNVIR